MKELSKAQSIIFAVGGVFMVIGAGCFAFMWQQQTVCWLFTIGSIMFGIMQLKQQYLGSNFVVRRLKRIQGIAGVLFVLSGLLMIDYSYEFLKDSIIGYNNYIQYIYNKWVVILIIAAILEVYTTHRISSELEKEKTPK